MYITHQADSSILCKSDELTLLDVVSLNQESFSSRASIEIHCNTIRPNAINAFHQFLQTINCKELEVYIGRTSYETAKAIFDVAKLNVHPSKMKLDLGEQFLVFFSKDALSKKEINDIYDHLISGVYKDQHTLVIDYRSMQYLQAVTLVTALWHASLNALFIDCDILDNETKQYLSSHLSSFASVMKIHLNVHDQPISRSRGTSAPAELFYLDNQALPLLFPTSTSAPTLAPVRRNINNPLPLLTSASAPTLAPRRLYESPSETMITIHAAEAVGVNCDEHHRISLEITESECECGPLKCLKSALTWAFSGMLFCPPAAEFIADADETPRAHFKNT
ncbi:hypothetical protein [Candidatus Berkiella aquae]|uniref:Uncharacterized protein n=1 Tax=Candidatus Berkiella aquae TaxID=295108 RepID=A0A0Q9Y983_9GAMM|nr:hypothetical protein [Candidatus Berkiella aquae]MCS5709969.1 hypothetical protein [Candidatus Berkiella aquae]